MDDSLSKKKPSALPTVVENEPPQDKGQGTAQVTERDSDAESHSSSVVEKDAASASGSTTSEDLLYLDDSVTAMKPVSENVTATSPFGASRSAKLPPRAPTAPSDAEVEGVLPSQPSMVRRMQEPNKHDVDPKDARNLLPGVLLNSGSLDLDGVMDGIDAPPNPLSRATEKKLQEEALISLLRQKELENLYLAQQQQRQQQELLLAASASGLDLELLSALNLQCRLSPPGFPTPSRPPAQQEIPANNFLYPQQPQQQTQPQQQQQVFPRSRHSRSVSDPTCAFGAALQSMPPPPSVPLHQMPSVDPVVTTPLVDQADALAFLSRSNLPQADWTSPELQLQPVLRNGGGGLLSVTSPNSLQPEMSSMESAPPQKRRTHRPSKSVDFNLLMKQNKNRNNTSSAKERHAPLSPSAGNKSTTRAEVKKMVEQQARLGRPTYAPWFRDRSNRSNTPREGDAPAELPPAHYRTQSLPHVNTLPGSPKEEKNQDPQQNTTPKSSRAGTGVFFPRMQVPN